MWLAVDKVIHHHDVSPPIIWAWRNVARYDPDSCDERLIEHDAEKRQARVTGRSRDEAAEQHLAVGAEILNLRARPTVSSKSLPIRLVNVCENRTKARHHCWGRPIGAGYKKHSIGEVAPHWSEQSQRAEGAEDGGVGRIVEKHFKAALGPAGRRRLGKA